MLRRFKTYARSVGTAFAFFRHITAHQIIAFVAPGFDMLSAFVRVITVIGTVLSVLSGNKYNIIHAGISLLFLTYRLIHYIMY